MMLVTGANGQLGSELRALLPEATTLFVDVDRLDITNLEACRRFVAEHGVETVVNAAAYTQVDKAETEKDLAFAVNATGPANLARALAEEGTGKRCMVHISTDYVFDGRGPTPYVETDPTAPQSVYGHTKLAGEQAVQNLAPTAVVLRTAWLYSAFGANFLKTMVRLGADRAAKGEALNVVFDQVGSPTHAGHLARDILKILPQLESGHNALYHYTDEGVTSWYDFATVILEKAHINCRVQPIRSAAYPTPAVRPAYSVLDKTRVKQAFNLQLNHWQEDIFPCLSHLSLPPR